MFTFLIEYNGKKVMDGYGKTVEKNNVILNQRYSFKTKSL